VVERFNEKQKISSGVGYSANIALTRHAATEGGGAETQADHFVEHEGVRFAGTHLILDLWQASNLDDINAVGAMFHEATRAAGATILKVNLHRFTPSGGITGVAITEAVTSKRILDFLQNYSILPVFFCWQLIS
jgi:hypothetical protein